MVSDLARGGDLLEALRAKPTGFGEEEGRDLMRQACEGLRFLHRSNVALQVPWLKTAPPRNTLSGQLGSGFPLLLFHPV